MAAVSTGLFAEEFVHNEGISLDLEWVTSVSVNYGAVQAYVETLVSRCPLSKVHQAAYLLRAVTCIDLTTLAGDDTPANVARLCHKAKHPIQEKYLKALNLGDADIQTGAVCVYPAMVPHCVNALKKLETSKSRPSLPIAAVATGFPSGQYSIKTRLEEIRQAVSDGALEIDIVINRTLALQNDWQGLYDELRDMKEACGTAHMKSILAIGELGSAKNIYQASLVAMMADDVTTQYKIYRISSINARGAISVIPPTTWQTKANPAGFTGLFAAIEPTCAFSPVPNKTPWGYYNRGAAIATNENKMGFYFGGGLIRAGHYLRNYGSDFIKTSTGKEAVNATLPVGLIMARAIMAYWRRTGFTVGFKPAGGIRTASQAIQWLVLMQDTLGPLWTHNNLFRIGASALLTDIEKELHFNLYGSYAVNDDFPMA